VLERAQGKREKIGKMSLIEKIAGLIAVGVLAISGCWVAFGTNVTELPDVPVLSISTASQIFRAGSPVVVVVTIGNTSTEAISIDKSLDGGLSGTFLRVIDSKGNPVPERRRSKADFLHNKISARVDALPKAVDLKPGEEMKLEFALHQLFELKKPDIYTVQAFRFAKYDTLVSSNKIGITVQ
jgi:hypothetical protein